MLMIGVRVPDVSLFRHPEFMEVFPPPVSVFSLKANVYQIALFLICVRLVSIFVVDLVA